MKIENEIIVQKTNTSHPLVGPVNCSIDRRGAAYIWQDYKGCVEGGWPSGGQEWDVRGDTAGMGML